MSSLSKGTAGDALICGMADEQSEPQTASGDVCRKALPPRGPAASLTACLLVQ